MRKFAIGKASPVTDGDSKPADKNAGSKGWFREHWRLVSLFAIIVCAFLVRFVFAYGISAGDNYALSGGTSATSNLRIVTEILTGTYNPANEAALNYPYGSVSIYGPLFDYVIAALAFVVTLFGVSTGTAAAGVLAWTAPIFAALTCYPVYLIGKKMFNNDEVIGVISALFYAFFALLIMTTAFSNGSAFGFVGLLFAWMVYFTLSALQAADRTNAVGFKAAYREKSIRWPMLVASLLFLGIVLSWNEFYVIVVLAIVGLIIGQIIDRIQERDIAVVTVIIDTELLIGVLVSALYYIPVGLWDAVFSGPFCLALCFIGISLFFAATRKKSWVLMIPVTVAILVIAAVLLFFFAPDLLNNMIHGNSLYTGPLMVALTSTFSRTSISEMASYYGWLTVWFPLIMGLYMIYRFRSRGGSRVYSFTIIWLLAMFFVAWFSGDYAIIAGSGFAVGIAALTVKIVRSVGMKAYFSSLRGNGFKAGAKKSLQFIPLVAILVVVGLIIVPNAVYAVDAATPTNNEESNYFGGLGYTIDTSNSSLVHSMWSSYSTSAKTGAMITWFGYSNDAVNIGNFDSVTDVTGGGTETASAFLLSTASGASTAVLAVRLMMANGVSEFKTAITAAGLDYDTVAGYINNPATAVKYIQDNSDSFSGISSDVTETNAVYLVEAKYITDTIGASEINSFYSSVCTTCGQAITYCEVDGSMLPMYYGDGSYFSTIAYLGNYTLDSYSAPTQFYSYNTYTGYATYTDAMYDTYLWRALIGISASEAGYTSTSSFLSALALSDGTVKAVPGYGISGVTVSYWHVKYNADSDATLSSSGWVDMDAYEAIAKQNSDGGLINYLASVVVLSYDASSYNTESGTVTYTDASGDSVAAAGVKVAVFEKTSYDSSGVTNYVQRCTVFTDANGGYSVEVPSSGDYYVVYYSGSTDFRDGTPIATYTNQVPASLAITATTLSGVLTTTTDVVYEASGYIVLTGTASGKTYQATVTDGKFDCGYVMPDTYTAVVYSATGATLNTVTLTVSAGINSGLQVDATSGTLTVTVTDEYGTSETSGTVYAVDTTSGYQFSGSLTSAGTVVLNLVPGTYSVYASDSIVSSSTTTVTVTSDSSKTATLTAYTSKAVKVTGVESGQAVTLMALGFTTSSTTGTLYVPSVGGINAYYTAYAVSGSTVYHGYGNGSTITMTSSTAATVKGTVLNTDGEALNTGNTTDLVATVAFISATGETFVFSSDTDGAFTAVIPVGEYTVYINNGTDGAYLAKATITGDQDLGGITLSEGRSVTATFNYTTRTSSSTTKGIAFCDVSASLTVDGTEYTVMMLTNSSGKAVFWVPANIAVTCTLSEFTTSAFSVTADQTATAEASSTNRSLTAWTLAGLKSDDSEVLYVNTTMVSCDYTASLTAYSDSSLTYTLGKTAVSVVPGQYTCVVSGGTGYYYSGTVYINPGTTQLSLSDVIEVATVTITASTGDTVTVTAVEDADGNTGEYHVADSDKHIYYVQAGYSYYFKAISGSLSTTTQIAYASVDSVAMGASYAFDLQTKAAQASITGYLGVAGSGTITVSYTDANGKAVSVPFTVTSGAYTLTVPAGFDLTLKAVLTQTVSNVIYTYSGTTTISATADVDGTKCNYSVLTDSSESSYTNISGSGYSFANGIGKLKVTISNTGSLAVTYLLSAGSAWTLDQNYVLTVAAGSTASIDISGHYNSLLIGAGNANLTVVVTTVDSTSVGSFLIPATAFAVNTSIGSTTIDIAGGSDKASADALNGYTYKYAITIVNPDSFVKLAKITATIDAADWTVTIINSAGTLTYASGTQFEVNGFATTTIYVMLICSDGKSTSVPGVSLSVVLTDKDGGIQTMTTSSSGLTVIGNTATGTLTAGEAEVSQTAATASGTDVELNAKALSTTFWVMTVLTVLTMLLMFWAGMKRGVFSRRK